MDYKDNVLYSYPDKSLIGPPLPEYKIVAMHFSGGDSYAVGRVGNYNWSRTDATPIIEFIPLPVIPCGYIADVPISSRRFYSLAFLTDTARPKKHRTHSDSRRHLLAEETFSGGLNVASGIPRIVIDELDPHGKSQHETGAKLDAGKPQLALMLKQFQAALFAVAELTNLGAKKYTPEGWRYVPDGVNRYGEALLRHEFQVLKGVKHVPDMPQVLEATAVAWNALARLELLLGEEKE